MQMQKKAYNFVILVKIQVQCSSTNSNLTPIVFRLASRISLRISHLPPLQSKQKIVIRLL